MKAGRKGYYGFASKGQRRPRWFGAGLAIGVVAAILTGCSIFHKTSIGETPSPSTLDDMRSAKPLPHKGASSAPVVGLALGGGGLRGYAHIGVLQALEESGISVEVVAGTSAGSIIGAAYSSGRTVEEIRQAAENLDVSSLTDWRLSTTSLLRGDALAKWASDMAHNMPIENMPRKFGAVAAVLDTGEAVLIDKGDVGMAIRASAAIPGSMQPIESTLGMLVDGGISSLVPVRFARAMGAEVVIGVDIYCNSPHRSGSTFLTTIARVSRTQTCLISGVESAEADVLITPSVEITDVKSAVQREEAILAGYRAAKVAMPTVLDRINSHASMKSMAAHFDQPPRSAGAHHRQPGSGTAALSAAVLQQGDFAMSTNKLRLGPLPKSETVKLTFICPADLKADLDRYAALHGQTYGEPVDALTLIPHMLEAFMAWDRGFRKGAMAKAVQT